jgi:large subunit ribosomal protein L21
LSLALGEHIFIRGRKEGVMYAIVQTGSKQYRVKKGDVIHVEKLQANLGEEVGLKDVLFLARDDGSFELGRPTVHGCTVIAKYMKESKGPKIHSVKYKLRKNERRKFGHRQHYSQLEILDIQG